MRSVPARRSRYTSNHFTEDDVAEQHDDEGCCESDDAAGRLGSAQAFSGEHSRCAIVGSATTPSVVDATVMPAGRWRA